MSTVFTAPNPNNPLTVQHLADINNALAALDAAQFQAEQAQRAGIDQAANLQQIAQQRAQLRQIKGVYFPGQ